MYKSPNKRGREVGQHPKQKPSPRQSASKKQRSSSKSTATPKGKGNNDSKKSSSGAWDEVYNQDMGRYDHVDPENEELSFGALHWASGKHTDRDVVEALDPSKGKYRGAKTARAAMKNEGGEREEEEGASEASDSDLQHGFESEEDDEEKRERERSDELSEGVDDDDDVDGEEAVAPVIGEHLSEQVTSDLVKATHTLTQKKIWDTLLNLRIKMQPLLVGANRLPLAEARPAYRGDKKLRRGMRKAAQTLEGLTGTLLQLQAALVSLNPQTAAAAAAAAADVESSEEGGKGGGEDGPFGELWGQVVTMQQTLEPHCFAVIDAWNQKTSLAAHKITQASFKALNQSIGAQLGATLQNKEKLRRRTQAKRTLGAVFGMGLTAEEFNPQQSEEIFDDTDFYQLLLRDLIDSTKAADDPFESSRNWLALREQSAKLKKLVLPKSSRDRVLRYHTQEPLVNYMAPVPLHTAPYTEQIFNELFKCTQP